jgi:hypothetical protein
MQEQRRNNDENKHKNKKPSREGDGFGLLAGAGFGLRGRLLFELRAILLFVFAVDLAFDHHALTLNIAPIAVVHGCVSVPDFPAQKCITPDKAGSRGEADERW